MTIMIKETMKTSVVGAEREILQSQSVLSPQGQYLLRASMADNGIVAARAKSVTAKWNISMFRGVRTWKKVYNTNKKSYVNTSWGTDFLFESYSKNGFPDIPNLILLIWYWFLSIYFF